MNLVNLSCFWELHWISREKSQISFKKRITDSISSFHDGYVLARRNQLFTWTIESDWNTRVFTLDWPPVLVTVPHPLVGTLNAKFERPLPNWTYLQTWSIYQWKSEEVIGFTYLSWVDIATKLDRGHRTTWMLFLQNCVNGTTSIRPVSSSLKSWINSLVTTKHETNEENVMSAYQWLIIWELNWLVIH